MNTSNETIPEDDGNAHMQVGSTEGDLSKTKVNKNNAILKCGAINSMHFVSQMNSMIEHLKEMFPEKSNTKENMLLLEAARKSYLLADEVFTAQDAEEWGNGFIVNEELLASDERLFQASMRDITTMSRRRKKLLEPTRLNRLRVESSTQRDNPE